MHSNILYDFCVIPTVHVTCSSLEPPAELSLASFTLHFSERVLLEIDKGLSRKQPLPTWQYCLSIYLTEGHYFYFISQLSAATSCWCVYHINTTIQLITHTGSRTAGARDKQQLSDEVRILCDSVSASHCMVGMPTMLQGYVICEERALGKETHFIFGTLFTVRTG